MTWHSDLPATGSQGASAEIRTNWGHIERSLLGRSLVADGVMEIWAGGDAAAPTHYTLSGTGATIARAGTGLGDTTTYGLGGFCAKITYGSAPAVLQQTLFDTLPTYFRGRTFVAAVACKTSNISQCKLQLYDGVSQGESSFHTGGGSFEWLVATRTLDVAATRLDLRMQVAAAGSAYFEGACALYGEIPPPIFIPCPTAIGAYVFPLAGQQATGTDLARAIPRRPGIVRDTQLHSKTGPTGAAFVLDVNTWDGSALTTMYTTKPQIAAGAIFGAAQPDGTYARRCLSPIFGSTRKAGDELSVDIDQIGSTIAGSDITISIMILQYMRPQERWLGYSQVA